jgi:predicted amidohydrolase YtcJ
MQVDISVIYRHMALLVSLIVALLGNGSCLAQTADVIYINAEIYTLDPKYPWANAVAIQGDKFIAVGSDEDIEKFVGKNTVVVDLLGRMVMPGIHDAHTHLEWAGIFMHHECALPYNATPEMIVETLMDCDIRRPGNWITTGLYSPFIFENGRPDNTFLDEAFPNTPVYLTDFSAHHGLANTKALELAGITVTTSDPEGGIIVRDPETGAATGELVETANSVMQRVIPAYDDGVYREALRWAIKVSNQYGITSVQEASATRRELQFLNELDSNNELSLRVSAHLVWQYENFADTTLSEIQKLREDRARYQTSRVDTRFIKFWLDGAPLPPNFTHSGLDDSNRVVADKLLISQQDLNQALASLDRQGLIVKMHVAGKGAARTAINALEHTRKVNGDSGLRHELSHAGFVHEDDMRRMKSVGAVAELSPAVWHMDIPGFEILSEAYKFKSLQNNGVHMTVGSDWIIMPTPNIFPGLQGMLERGEESIDLASALASMTINGAQVTRQDHLIGSIEKGKYATFIVLDQNLFEIPVKKIQETSVDMTIFEGRVVYKAN